MSRAYSDVKMAALELSTGISSGPRTMNGMEAYFLINTMGISAKPLNGMWMEHMGTQTKLTGSKLLAEGLLFRPKAKLSLGQCSFKGLLRLTALKLCQ